MKTKLLLIGLGFAGNRFRKVIEYYSNRYEIAGIADIEQNALNEIDGKYPKFTNLDKALSSVAFDTAVITVNEVAHFSVLRKIIKVNKKNVILSEKPLLSTIEELRILNDDLLDTDISVNLVERYSTVIDTFFDWRNQQAELFPVRVNFFWGKNRIKDHRPTMGVISEIIHPIDLIDFLFPFKQWEVITAQGICSDFSRHDHKVLDTVNVVAKTEGYNVIGHSSFTWNMRHRTLAAILTNKNNELYFVTFNFDNPKWDCDELLIYKIVNNKKEIIVHSKTTNAQYPRELEEIYKVSSFFCQSIDHFNGKKIKNPNIIVDYHQAKKLQALLYDIGTKIDHSDNNIYFPFFNNHNSPGRFIDADATAFPIDKTSSPVLNNDQKSLEVL